MRKLLSLLPFVVFCSPVLAQGRVGTGPLDPPASAGHVNDLYLNTTTERLFKKDALGWHQEDDLQHSSWLSGTGAPAPGIGQVDDLYLNTTTSDYYRKQDATTWVLQGSLQGAAGAPGPQGPAGPATNAWSLTGNAGITLTTNFIGTTDAVPLQFKVNNERAGLIETAAISHSHNTFFGFHAGLLSTNRRGGQQDNTAFGCNALAGLREVNYGNTAVGGSALENDTADYNTAVGTDAARYHVTAIYNTAVGYYALRSDPGAGGKGGANTGSDNTACGAQSLYRNSTGNWNTALGFRSLHDNTAGYDNAAMGGWALASNTTGSANTAGGREALVANLSGGQNTAFGHAALSTNATGEMNAALGANALLANTTGSRNTAVGFAADVAQNNLTNATAIGYNAKVSSSNALVLGATGPEQVHVGIGTSSPAALLHVVGGDVYIDAPLSAMGTNGLILHSPSGTCWRITVDDSGALRTVAVDCP